MLLSLTEQEPLRDAGDWHLKAPSCVWAQHYAPLSHDQVDCTLFTETQNQTRHTQTLRPILPSAGPEWSAHIIPKQRSWKQQQAANAPQVHIVCFECKCVRHMLFCLCECFFSILSIFFSHTHCTHTHTLKWQSHWALCCLCRDICLHGRCRWQVGNW